MRSGTRVALRNGDTHYCVETPEQVVAKRKEARLNGEMVCLESTAIPTGQHFWLDPYEIASVKREA
jgi:hypothetical protein